MKHRTQTLAGFHCHIYGEGAKVALALHGWVGTGETFARVCEFLPDYTVIAPDLPGYGDTPAEKEGPNLQALFHSLEALRAATGCQVLIGNCSGAALLAIASHHGFFRTTPMVLVEPFGRAPLYFRIFTWPLVGVLFYWFAFLNPVGQWIVNRANAESVEEDLGGDFAQVPMATTLAYLRLLAACRIQAPLAGHKAPITLVSGLDTFKAVEQTCERWADQSQTVEHVRLPGGHLLLQSAPEPFAQVLNAHHPFTPAPRLEKYVAVTPVPRAQKSSVPG